MQSVVGVDPNQMRIECRVMDFGEGKAVRDDRLAQLLVRVRDDVGGVEQHRLGQPGQGAAAAVGRYDGFAERRLV